MLEEVATQAKRHPSSYAYWMQVARSIKRVACEVSISGEGAMEAYIAFRLGAKTQGIRYAVKQEKGSALSFSVCRNGVCYLPETDISRALGLTF
jgi:hypothetical protein